MVWKGWKSTITSLNMKRCKFSSSSWECHSCVGISFLYWGYGNTFQEESWHYSIQFIQFYCLVVSDSLRPHGLQHTRPPCPSPTPRVYSNSWPLSDAILCHLLLFLSSIFPSIRVFSNVSSLHQVAKGLGFQLQHQAFQWIFRTDLL